MRERRGPRSQREVAEPVGLGANQWSTYERGQVYPGDSNRGKIARALGCDSLDQFDLLVSKYFERQLGSPESGRPPLDADLDWRDHLRASYHHLHLAIELALAGRGQPGPERD